MDALFQLSTTVGSQRSGTGKTHTLVEIIRQLTTITPSNPKPQRLLVCGASNLSVDNVVERLLALPPREKAETLIITRIGHPARVMTNEGVLESTLEVKAARTDQVCSDIYGGLPSTTVCEMCACWLSGSPS